MELFIPLDNTPQKKSGADAEKGICPVCGSETIMQSGCETCPVCGWAKCNVS